MLELLGDKLIIKTRGIKDMKNYMNKFKCVRLYKAYMQTEK